MWERGRILWLLAMVALAVVGAAVWQGCSRPAGLTNRGAELTWPDDLDESDSVRAIPAQEEKR